jgi:hypothetical protein
MKHGRAKPTRILIKLFMMLPMFSLLLACGGSDDGQAVTLFPGDPQLRTRSGAYEDVLASCVVLEELQQSCSLETLPLIGMETEDPTVADIMSRVLVSHEWMAMRFEQALNLLPPDILLLLRATTATVIDDDIRPAFYTVETGAIYLDPAYLWLTETELATINPQADFRAGFSDPLQFRSLHRYVRDGNHVYPYGLLQPNSSKTIDDVVFLIAQLLYHELAHANDFLPPNTWDLLDRNATVLEAIIANEPNFVALHLHEFDPLRSDILRSLGEVMYEGRTPSAADLEITAAEVGEEFEFDVANDHYAYANATPYSFEDSAMLFEEAMMKYHFDIDRDIAFTSAPPDPTFCDGYTIGWGVRNRLGDTDVKARAQLVTSEILPSASADMSLFFQDFPLPNFMTPGTNWCDSINMAAPLDGAMQKTQMRTLPPGDLRKLH